MKGNQHGDHSSGLHDGTGIAAGTAAVGALHKANEETEQDNQQGNKSCPPQGGKNGK